MTTTQTEDQTDTESVTRAKLLDLSLTQLLGGSMAAATAAALGSRLGVMGTIVGAAVGSVVTAVAASIYTGSMARAREAVMAARAYSRGQAQAPRPVWWRRPDKAATRRILVTTGAIFAIAAAFLTGLQLATGAPVTGTDIGGRSAATGTSDRSFTSEGRAADVPDRATNSPITTGTPAPAATTGSAVTDPAVPADTPTGDPQTTRPAEGSSDPATSAASPATSPASTSAPSGETTTPISAAH